MIMSGLLVGLLSVFTFIILIEKLPVKFKAFIFGHHLLTDIIMTAFAFLILPVTGITALLAASVFCLTFTIYLFIRRHTIDWRKITMSQGHLFIEYSQSENNKK